MAAKAKAFAWLESTLPTKLPSDDVLNQEWELRLEAVNSFATVFIGFTGAVPVDVEDFFTTDGLAGMVEPFVRHAFASVIREGELAETDADITLVDEALDRTNATLDDLQDDLTKAEQEVADAERVVNTANETVVTETVMVNVSACPALWQTGSGSLDAAAVEEAVLKQTTVAWVEVTLDGDVNAQGEQQLTILATLPASDDTSSLDAFAATACAGTITIIEGGGIAITEFYSVSFRPETALEHDVISSYLTDHLKAEYSGTLTVAVASCDTIQEHLGAKHAFVRLSTLGDGSAPVNISDPGEAAALLDVLQAFDLGMAVDTSTEELFTQMTHKCAVADAAVDLDTAEHERDTAQTELDNAQEELDDLLEQKNNLTKQQEDLKNNLDNLTTPAPAGDSTTTIATTTTTTAKATTQDTNNSGGGGNVNAASGSGSSGSSDGLGLYVGAAAAGIALIALIVLIVFRKNSKREIARLQSNQQNSGSKGLSRMGSSMTRVNPLAGASTSLWSQPAEPTASKAKSRPLPDIEAGQDEPTYLDIHPEPQQNARVNAAFENPLYDQGNDGIYDQTEFTNPSEGLYDEVPAAMMDE